mmetsp:Transcript_142445/g.442923  ORF Transcript_142445/g.442923 Transcript_142445/m.442923 type:complete len:299 (+) Transcript_142445:50-946(+)
MGWRCAPLALASALVLLRLAAALRVPAAREDLPRTAVCVSGNARTMPQVATAFHMFVNQMLPGSGIVRQGHPDVFAYITLQGAGPKGQKGYDFVAANVSREVVEAALRPVQPVKYILEPNPDEVTPENIDSYVRHRKECFSSGYYSRTPDGLRRTLNQLVHWQRCLDLMVEQERVSGQQYEAVVITRPDITYYKDRFIDLKAVAESGHYVGWKDLTMVMPRRVAGLLLGPRARPLSCARGQRCCGKVGQSEELWEYIMGVRVDNRGSCNCGPSAKETGPLVPQTNMSIGKIFRPDRSV